MQTRKDGPPDPHDLEGAIKMSPSGGGRDYYVLKTGELYFPELESKRALNRAALLLPPA